MKKLNIAKLEINEVKALADLTREIVFNAFSQENNPTVIPRRRLQSIKLINEASELLDAAVINLVHEHAVEDEA